MLAAEDGVPAAALLVEHLYAFALACRELPTPRDGFAVYKRDAPVFPGHREFAVHYADRYWAPVRPFYDGISTGAAVDTWLSGGFAAALRHSPGPGTVTAVDANLKNFLIAPDDRIVVLNVPIAARSTPAHTVGAISARLRNRPQHRDFLDAARREVRPDDAGLVPHFELSTLLGIMSFYAVRAPRRHREWRNWGSPVSLDEDFRALVSTEFSAPGPS